MRYAIATHQVGPQAIVSIRGRRALDDLPAFIKAAIPELLGRLRLLGISPSGPPFVVYHEFGADGIDAEVSVPTDQPVAVSGRIESRMLPAMTVARTLHVGPYERVGAAYAAVSTWIRNHGFEVAGPISERYLSGPGDHVASTEYQTEIEMPNGDRDAHRPGRRGSARLRPAPTTRGMQRQGMQRPGGIASICH